MKKITLRLPTVQEAPEGKPSYCPRCDSTYLARHGRLKRPLADTTLSSVAVQRYRCSHCGFTFRHSPPGVGRARRSERVVVLAALLRSLGLSCMATAKVLGTAGAHISYSTVWRAVRAIGLRESQSRRPIKVRLLDPSEPWVDPEEGLVLRFVEDPKTGEKTGVEVRGYIELLPEELYEFVRASGAQLQAQQVV